MKGPKCNSEIVFAVLLVMVCCLVGCGGGGGSTTPPPPPTAAAAPSFSPTGGNYTSAQTVTLSTTTPGATIYYTTDGATPTASSAKYTGAISLNSSATLKAIATATGYLGSTVASATYTITIPTPAAMPVFTPNGGAFNVSGPLSVTITDSTPGAVIYYTTDGSAPTTSSAKYAGAISLTSTATIKAIATASGYLDSAAASATYAITVAPPPTYTWNSAVGVEDASVSQLLSPPSGPASIISGLADVCGFAHIDLTVSPAAGKFTDPDCVTTTGLDYGVTAYTNVDAWGDSLTFSAYPSLLSDILGIPVSNQGVAGQTSTQIKTRFLAATDKFADTAIIWAGQNNPSNPAVVLSDIAAMVAAMTPPKRFFVLSVLNGNYPGNEKGGSGYANIMAINGALAATYPGHYIDVRQPLIDAYDPNNPQDVIDHDRDIIPSSLRVDKIHLTSAGYQIVARTVANAMTSPLVIARVGLNASAPPFGGYSTDGGLSWTPFAAQPATAAGGGSIAVSADGKVFVWAPSDTASVYYSTDYGITWTASAGAPGGKPVIADKVNAKKFYLFDASAGVLYASADGGATFSAVNSTRPRNGMLAAASAAEGDLWIASNTGLYHSTDSGANFVQLASVQEGYAIGFGKAATEATYPAIYLAGKVGGIQAVFRSTDTGMSWVRINDDQHQYGWISPITGDPRIFGRVYLGTNGRGIIYGDSAN